MQGSLRIVDWNWSSRLEKSLAALNSRSKGFIHLGALATDPHAPHLVFVDLHIHLKGAEFAKHLSAHSAVMAPQKEFEIAVALSAAGRFAVRNPL